MFCAGDDIILHLRGHIYEIRGETGNTDNQIMIVLRMLLRLSQDGRVRDVRLHEEAAEYHEAAQKRDERGKSLLARDGGGEQLYVERGADGQLCKIVFAV